MPLLSPENRATAVLLAKGSFALAFLPFCALLILQRNLPLLGLNQRWTDVCATAAAVITIQLVVAWFAFAAWSLDAEHDVLDAQASSVLLRAAQPPSLPLLPAGSPHLQSQTPPRWSETSLPECALPTVSSPRNRLAGSHFLPDRGARWVKLAARTRG
jgi:hypothetical protein